MKPVSQSRPDSNTFLVNSSGEDLMSDDKHAEHSIFLISKSDIEGKDPHVSFAMIQTVDRLRREEAVLSLRSPLPGVCWLPNKSGSVAVRRSAMVSVRETNDVTDDDDAKRRHEQGAQTTSLPIGRDPDLRALICCLPLLSSGHSGRRLNIALPAWGWPNRSQLGKWSSNSWEEIFPRHAQISEGEAIECSLFHCTKLVNRRTRIRTSLGTG